MKSRVLIGPILSVICCDVALAVTPGLHSLNDGRTPLGVSSSVVLAVIDNAAVGQPNSQKTFLLDLKVSYADLVNGVVANKTWDLNQFGYAFGSDVVTFNVTGGYALESVNYSNFDKSGASPVPFTDPINTQWGVVTSGLNKADFLTTDLNSVITSSGSTGGAGGFVQDWITKTDTKLNGAQSTTVAPIAPGASWFDDGLLGFGSGAAGNPKAVVLVGGNGQAGHLFWVTNTDPTGDPNVQGTVKDLGTLTLSAQGVLAFSGTPGASPSPTPSASPSPSPSPTPSVSPSPTPTGTPFPVGVPTISSGPVIDVGQGARFKIPGNGFGGKKGKVLIGKKKAKIVSWSDSVVEVTVPALKTATYDLVLTTKTRKSATAFGRLFLHVPDLTGAQNPSSGFVNSQVNLVGRYLGVAKPKVTFISSSTRKSKRVKVLPGNTDTHIALVIPKSFKPDSYTILVSNSAGSSAPISFVITK